MKKVFACSLVGAAGLLAAHQGVAATASATATASSIEANAAAVEANSASSLAAPVIIITPSGTGYTDGDVVRLTFSGVSMLASAFGTTGTGATTVSCKTATNNEVFKLTLTSASATGATYQVSRTDTQTLPNVATCNFGSGFRMLQSSLNSTKWVAVNYTAETASGTVYDTLRQGEGNLATNHPIHRVESQFALFVNPTLTNTSRVNSGGFGWTRAANGLRTTQSSTGVIAANVGEDALRGEITSNVASLTSQIEFNGSTNTNVTSGIGGATFVSTAGGTVTNTYTGDFSFLDNNQNGCSASDLQTGYARMSAKRGTTVVNATISADCRTLTTTGAIPANATNVVETLTFTVGSASGTDNAYYDSASNSARVIPAQTIGISSAVTLATGSVVTRTGSQSWLDNAWTNSIPYMPYGSGISRIVYITNRSGVTATMKFDARNEANVACASTNFPTVSVRTGTTQSASTAIDAGIAACYGASYTGKVVINVTAVGVQPQRGDNVINGVIRGYSATTNANGAATRVTHQYVNSAGGTDSVDSLVNDPRTGFTSVSSTSLTTLAATAAGTGAGSIGSSSFLTSDTSVLDRRQSAIDIYSAYNANGNRVQVINPSNGR